MPDRFCLPCRALLALILLLAGLQAAAQPMLGKLPVGVGAAELGVLDTRGPIAVDATGTRVAYAAGGLRIQQVGSGSSQLASTVIPAALAWSGQGDRLAAGFEAEGRCSIRLFTAAGVGTSETSVPGRVCGLQWMKHGTLLILTVALEPFRFGTRMTQVLHRWDAGGEPTANVLNESILMPKVAAQLKEALPHILGFRLSPLEDEILYYRLYNPPALASQRRLLLYNLASGRGRVLGEVAMDAQGACFSGTGDRILYGDGVKEAHLADPWGGQVLSTLPGPGKRVALSPSGRLLALDGRLYRDGQLLATFPEDARILFPAKTGPIFVAAVGRLFRLTGLQDEPMGAWKEADAPRIRELRKWLSEGLIAPEDYRLKCPGGRP